ncbi:DUF998 domain-containing protein [Parashewanella spongiae]|uniref:DUF998 domain-containing protein n=1 Tax=Parashewanella spongiae TaxID=342950 RepID=A0A3A6UH13_9GAMM|nr:DUF998 domain-containing protein [Parashewanella spongiae]MCL1077528.1 DUF998 domain-containing protein [Parashewanella spongiae]RJY18268.1 DUF998 domain-containing protein [Parashewanella spongiae]
MKNRSLLIILPILSLLWLASTIIIGGIYYPNYSHTSQFISELGATGSPYGNYINYLGFIPTELLMFGFIAVCYKTLPASYLNKLGLLFIFFYSASLTIASLYPCDFECKPETPTTSHLIHIFSALPGYLGGITSILVLSFSSNNWNQEPSFKIASFTIAILASSAFLNISSDSNIVGVYQRILEVLIYSWFIFFGYQLSRQS